MLWDPSLIWGVTAFRCFGRNHPTKPFTPSGTRDFSWGWWRKMHQIALVNVPLFFQSYCFLCNKDRFLSFHLSFTSSSFFTLLLLVNRKATHSIMLLIHVVELFRLVQVDEAERDDSVHTGIFTRFIIKRMCSLKSGQPFHSAHVSSLTAKLRPNFRWTWIRQ